MAQINPTRMNLINLRKKVVIASKGHDILKRKRNVLVSEFMKTLKQSRAGRTYLNEILQGAYKTSMIASAYVGDLELQETAYHIKEAEPVSVTVKNVMGVKVPEIRKGQIARSPVPLSASVAADDMNESFSTALAAMIDVAEAEQGIRRMVLEIEKTKRRVNALENVTIPRLKRDAKYISTRLEEMDRDMFSALKHVKKKLEVTQE